MSTIENVSRREFLTGLSFHRRLRPRRTVAAAICLGRRRCSSGTSAASITPFSIPISSLRIDTDGTVYIVAHRSEMGTGSRTACL